MVMKNAEVNDLGYLNLYRNPNSEEYITEKANTDPTFNINESIHNLKNGNNISSNFIDSFGNKFDSLSWHILSSNWMGYSEDTIRNWIDKWNWDDLSLNNVSSKFLYDFQNRIISINSWLINQIEFDLPTQVIRDFRDKMDWNEFCVDRDRMFPDDFVIEFVEYIDWHTVINKGLASKQALNQCQETILNNYSASQKQEMNNFKERINLYLEGK